MEDKFPQQQQNYLFEKACDRTNVKLVKYLGEIFKIDDYTAFSGFRDAYVHLGYNLHKPLAEQNRQNWIEIMVWIIYKYPIITTMYPGDKQYHKVINLLTDVYLKNKYLDYMLRKSSGKYPIDDRDVSEINKYNSNEILFESKLLPVDLTYQLDPTIFNENT